MGNELQKELLNTILTANQATDYGKKYNFANLKTIEAYQNVLPITCYDNFAPMIKLTTRLGESDIFTSLPLACYSLVFGNTGTPKLMPCSQVQMKNYTDQMQDLFAKGSTFALAESMPQGKPFEDGVVLNTISGALLTEWRKGLRDNSHARLITKGAWTSPAELLFPEDVFDQRHVRLLFALMDKNVTQIVAPFTWGVFDTFAYLEKNWKMLVDDISKGTIDETVQLPEAVRKKLLSKIKKDPKRAKELQIIFEKGFEEPVVLQIWPQLTHIVAISAGSFRIYTEKLRRYTGDIPIDSGFYATPEALIAKSLKADCEEYALLPQAVFYEFIPIGKEVEKPLTMDQLEVGEKYGVIITNRSGFYRYRLEDVIEVIRYENEVPIVKCCYRISQSADFAGALVTEQDIDEVIVGFQKKTGIDINDFCFWKNDEGDTCTILVEPSEVSENAEKVAGITVQEASEIAEELLAKVNSVYAERRSDGVLKPCHVMFLESQTHLLYRDVINHRTKTAPDQIRPIRILDNPVKEKFFFGLVEKK